MYFWTYHLNMRQKASQLIWSFHKPMFCKEYCGLLSANTFQGLLAALPEVANTSVYLVYFVTQIRSPRSATVYLSSRNYLEPSRLVQELTVQYSTVQNYDPDKASLQTSCLHSWVLSAGNVSVLYWVIKSAQATGQCGWQGFVGCLQIDPRWPAYRRGAYATCLTAKSSVQFSILKYWKQGSRS